LPYSWYHNFEKKELEIRNINERVVCEFRSINIGDSNTNESFYGFLKHKDFRTFLKKIKSLNIEEDKKSLTLIQRLLAEKKRQEAEKKEEGRREKILNESGYMTVPDTTYQIVGVDTFMNIGAKTIVIPTKKKWYSAKKKVK
jgi:hypothetical protein